MSRPWTEPVEPGTALMLAATEALAGRYPNLAAHLRVLAPQRRTLADALVCLRYHLDAERLAALTPELRARIVEAP